MLSHIFMLHEIYIRDSFLQMTQWSRPTFLRSFLTVTSFRVKPNIFIDFTDSSDRNSFTTFIHLISNFLCGNMLFAGLSMIVSVLEGSDFERTTIIFVSNSFFSPGFIFFPGISLPFIALACVIRPCLQFIYTISSCFHSDVLHVLVCQVDVFGF